MQLDDLLKPLGVFVLVVVLVALVAGVAGLVLTGGGSAPSEAGEYSKQVPSQFKPSNAIAPVDEERGEIQLSGDAEAKRILIDTRHNNRFSREEIEPLVNALVRNGHTVKFQGSTTTDTGFGEPNYNRTLQQFDAVLIIQPTSAIPPEQIAGLQAFTRAGGRVAVLAEPTQIATSGGLFPSSSTIRTKVNDLTMEYGIRVGSESLYNVADKKNDNNYQSIYATSVTADPLTERVNRIDLSLSSYIVDQPNNATTLFRAVNGTKKLSTRRSARYAVAARSGNLTVVADSSFITVSEVYDSDNEKLVSNLLTFLVSGDKVEGAPQAGGETGDGFGRQTPPDRETPPPRETAQATRVPEETPTRTPTPSA